MADAHAAARDGDLEALNTFIAAGSNLNQRDKHSRTPLHLAAWAGRVSAEIDKHVASCSYFHQTLHWSAHWPPTCLLALQAECAEALLKAGCDLKALAQDETSALHFAAQTGRTDVCRILLNAGEPREQHALQYALAVATCAQKVSCAGVCRFEGELEDASGVHAAAQRGKGRCAATLPLVPRTLEPKSCLHHPGCAPAGHAATVELLLKRKATPSATNRNDQTPLSLATDDAVCALLQAAAAAAPDPGPAPEHGAMLKQPSAEAGGAAAAPGGAGSKPKRERHRGRKRRGADEDLGDADGFQPWRAPQFDQLAAAEAAAAAAEHGGAGGPQASAAEAPSVDPVGPAEGRGALPSASDRSGNSTGLQPAGGAPADASAHSADVAGAAPATESTTPAQDAPVVDKTPQEAPSIGPAERPAPAANGAGPGAGPGAGLGSATVRKRPRVALAHLGDEEEGGEEQ